MMLGWKMILATTLKEESMLLIVTVKFEVIHT
jgi:hypothetical protein